MPALLAFNVFWVVFSVGFYMKKIMDWGGSDERIK